jgi:hypothetical protein
MNINKKYLNKDIYMRKKFKIKLFFLALLVFTINACGYGWTSQPHSGAIIAYDPCKNSGDVDNLGIKTITPVGKNQLNIGIVLKSPCADVPAMGVNTLTLGVYDAGNVSIPNNLSDIHASIPASKCDKDSGILTPTPQEMENDHKDAFPFVAGTAVSFVVGSIHRNSLYFFSTKIPYAVTKIGTGSKCVDNIGDFSIFDPFIVDQTTLSPVSKANGGSEYIYQSSVFQEAGVVALSGGYGLIGLAPPFTVGTLATNNKEYKGLESSRGISSDGSYYQFTLHIKPSKSGRGYYFVLSTVDNPTGALEGNYSLNHEKVYNANGVKDYQKDCLRDITSCGTAVNPN